MQKVWSHRGLAAWLLWPLSWVYWTLTALRSWLYRTGVWASTHPGKPVIVVGNVIAGGAGKTPVVMQLTRYLQAQGWQPGVISRGYGRSTNDCREVFASSPANLVGDEPALIARMCQVPLFVSRQRTQAAKALLSAHPTTDVLICDDGLQHHALLRDIEICVFPADGIGNGWLLPAGPLRETWPRPVDAILYAGAHPPAGNQAPAFQVQRTLSQHAINGHGQRILLQDLQNTPLHAIAAIARPDDFFHMLTAQGLTLSHTTALPDHSTFEHLNMDANPSATWVCTEKDATKLWQKAPQAWAVGLDIGIPDAFYHHLMQQLHKKTMPAR